jgi:rubredoxin
MQSRRNSHARLLNADPTKYPSFRPKNGPPKSIVRTQKTFESGPENFHTPVVNLDLKQYAITAQFPRSPAECRSHQISKFSPRKWSTEINGAHAENVRIRP